jgi:hypothetical protein
VVFHSNSSQIMVANNRISGALAETVESDPSAYDDPPADIDDNVIGVYCINSGATDSPIGVIVANNQISLCDVGVYAPVKRGGQAYGNTIFNCIVGIATSGTANGSARIRGNRLYLCKYAFWAPAAILGRNAIEDCTNIVYGRTGALVFLDGFVFRKQATNIAAGTTVDWPIMAVTRIANGKISAHARYSTNWAVGGISASYDGTTLTTNRDNYIASGIIAISSTPSVVTTGTFGLRIQNAGGAAYDVEVEAEASGTFVMS